jgi:signal transduction histidine kinase
MPTTRDPWEQRLDWVLSAVLWGALTLSVTVTAVVEGATANVGISALLAGAWVVTMQTLPRRLRNSEQWGELLAVLGVVVSLIAMSLTGGSESGYVIFLAGPPLFAASFLGLRIGLETGALSIAGLFVVARALEQPLLDESTVQPAFLYSFIVVTFTQVRRILIETSERSAEVQAAATARVERIQSAHTLLTSLSELANTQELNPVTIGTVALRDLASAVPFLGGRVSVTSEDGEPVVVASLGDIAEDAVPQTYPIEMRGSNLGRLELWPEDGTSLGQYLPAIQPIVSQVGLAFDNVSLVQRIAHRTVYEERIRLARELHDNIGPSLASLGLRIDMLIYSATSDPELVRHLEGTREAVTALVEEVRTTVSDLRHDNVASIVEQAYEIAAESAGSGPEIRIAIREHRPPRPAVAVELRAILTEAVRNAVEHAGATMLRIEGEVDRDRGSISIHDDGTGFDADNLPKGHYGVLGMGERAAEIGGRLEIQSTPGAGSRVTIAWEAD